MLKIQDNVLQLLRKKLLVEIMSAQSFISYNELGYNRILATVDKACRITQYANINVSLTFTMISIDISTNAIYSYTYHSHGNDLLVT